MKWNEAQLKAITTRDKNVLVSASAGSGKTTVLIERLMRRILDDQIPLSSILAMTYTDAAANEMKKRLAKQLQSRLQEADDEQTRAYIRKQLSLLPDANISTIHSFCLSIVKKYYYVTDLTPKQVETILDPSLLAIYEQEACEEVLHEAMAQNDEDMQKLCALFSPRAENDEALKQAIFSLSQAASSFVDEQAYLQMCIDNYQPITSFQELPETIYQAFFDYLTSQLSIYSAQYDALAMRFTYREEVTEKQRTALTSKQIGIAAMKKALDQKDYDLFREQLIACAKVILPANPDKSNDPEYDQLRKQIQELEERLLAQLYSKEELFAQISEQRPLIRKLCELTSAYQKRFLMKKKQQQGMDFHDMESYALSILQEHEEIRNDYRMQFAEIMVDEFQDANDVQNVLVNLIARGNNVFRVGDIKQSIYGFRHAKPSIMRDLITHRGAQDEVIYLSNNYRSKQLLIDFNNALYEELMNTDDFTPAFHQEDIAYGGTPAQLQDNQPIIFHKLMWKELSAQLPASTSNPALKADYIAKEIARLHEEKRCKWKDFVVLTRSNSIKAEMKKAFSAYRIPFFIDAKSGFYESYGVSCILSYLRACVDPFDNIALVAALTSPLFAVSFEELAKWKQAMRQEQEYSYYAYLQKHPCDGFSAFLAHHQTILHASLKDLLNELYETNAFYLAHTSVQEKTNLDLLYEMACDFERQEGFGVTGFLRYVETLKQQESAEALPIGSEDDVVRVMSIHQSKGLQFKIVFLWSTVTFPALESKDLMICDNELGIAMDQIVLPMRYRKDTIMRMAMEHKKNKEELEEEMRILYVATTRAQDEMHIVDAITDESRLARSAITSPFLYLRRGYTSWLCSASHLKPGMVLTKTVSTTWQTEKKAYLQSKPQQDHFQKLTYAYAHQPLFYETPTAKKSDALPKLTLQNEGMQYGTALHAYIEKLGDLPWDSAKIQAVSQKWELPYQTGIENALLALAKQPLFQMAQQMPKRYYEAPFAILQDDTLLHGVIDFLAADEKELLLIDFKSDRVSNGDALLAHYRAQLQAYEDALHQIYPNHRIHSYLYSFHLEEMIEK